MTELNAREQLFLELVNRARMDPSAEAARYGLTDLNAGLPPGTISATPKQVLAPNALLTEAAESHSQWIIDTDTFSHTGVNNSNPGTRMANAGYLFAGTWGWSENIAFSGSTGTYNADAAVFEQHRELFLSAGHRENMLGGSYREVGIGALTGLYTDGATYNALVTTEDFAFAGTMSFVTGVTYNDTDNNRFYSIGEGVAGRFFEILQGTAVIGSAAGTSAGGYSIGTNATGVMELHILGNGLIADIGVSFALGSSNIKIDLTGNNTIEINASATLTRAILNLTLIGNASNGIGNQLSNTITANSASNPLLRGLDGADTITGGDGNDWIEGETGNDPCARRSESVLNQPV